MHQAILTLVILLLIAQTVLAQLLKDGDYRIYYGNYQAPITHRFFTAKPNKGDGYVKTYPREDSDYQIWRLRNKSNGKVTLESKGARGKYLGLRHSGAHPGNYLGVVHKPVRFRITRKFGGPFTAYEFAYPKKVDGETLVVSHDDSDGKEEPYFVNFAIQGTQGVLGAYKMSRVSD
ncbi:MAG: hypothetical protein J3Q66DRAFT_388051 [Benniella sp.]|nr:MAG: hypothetical protein J3Q66DRAFT_388051 [Benniella sp.]